MNSVFPSFGSMWRANRLASLLAGLVVGSIVLGGCSAQMPDLTQFKLPSTRQFLPSNVDTYVSPTTTKSLAPVGPTDMVDGQGYCAGTAPPADAGQGSEAGAAAATPAAAPPASQGAVGLDMTECEVVRALGQPQSVNLGANQRGERQVTMVFFAGERSGTYLFTSGRLSSLERGPEPPPPPKPERAAKKKPAAKKSPAPKPPPA
jgi:hypothetical protein